MRFGLLIAAILVLAGYSHGQIKSIYTDLIDTKCKTLELNDDEGGSYKGECAGTGQFKLHVIEGDLRQTVNVIDPNGREHELRFWEHFGAFSAVGPKAEWRIKNKKPIALIIRLNVSENPEKPELNTSYLIVSKITKDQACITDIVRPMRSQNADARRLADTASTRACKARAE